MSPAKLGVLLVFGAMLAAGLSGAAVITMTSWAPLLIAPSPIPASNSVLVERMVK